MFVIVFGNGGIIIIGGEVCGVMTISNIAPVVDDDDAARMLLSSAGDRFCRFVLCRSPCQSASQPVILLPAYVCMVKMEQAYCIDAAIPDSDAFVSLSEYQRRPF